MLDPLGMGTMYKSIVLTLFMLVSCISAESYQCDTLNIIPSCHCENAEIANQVIINCRHLNLTTVPNITGSFPYDIYEMTLAQNNIQTLPARAFAGLKIHRLDLRQNRLTAIHNDSFQDLENYLEELYLGAEIGANIPSPTVSLTSLNALRTLHLEYFVFPRPGVSVGSLDFLHGLTSLTLTHNQLRFFDKLSLPLNLTSLTVDHQDLSSVPIDVLRNLTQLESLTISNTLITSLDRDALKLNKKLAQLDLGHNKINALSAQCFDGISNSLRSLSLQDNPIPSVTSLNEIKQLTALTNLQLSDINLASLPAEADFLINKESLTSLNLDGNGLTTLGPNVFNNLGNLENLHLARNQLADCDDQVFADLSSLKYLDVGYQNLSSGQSLTLPKSLTSLSSLQTLTLSKTNLSQATLWPKISFLGSLKILQLDGTSLTSVADYTFINLAQLQALHLDGNNLTEVTQKMLTGLLSLRNLTLNRNKIPTISHCAFYGFTLSPPLYLELIGNPLHCDCKLKWLLEEYQAGKINLTGAETCQTPSEKYGVILSHLQPADLICTSADSTEPDAPCLELYSPVQNLTVTSTSTTSITISWTVRDVTIISHFKVRHMDMETLIPVLSDDIDAADRSFQVTGLKTSTQYSVCLFAYVSSNSNARSSCVVNSTLFSPSSEQQEDDDNSETGIIIGTIVAAVVLLALIAIILYLVCWRSRGAKDLPADPQPHVFTPSELPGMSANSREFTKPKAKQPPKVGRALDESIKVIVISDGQTAPVSPRHSVGSYQFLDRKHPNPNPDIIPGDLSTYHNMDSRPLPTAHMFMNTYYNGEVQSPHTYSETETK